MNIPKDSEFIINIIVICASSFDVDSHFYEFSNISIYLYFYSEIPIVLVFSQHVGFYTLVRLAMLYYSATLCNIIQYYIIPHNTIQHKTSLQHSHTQSQNTHKECTKTQTINGSRRFLRGLLCCCLLGSIYQSQSLALIIHHLKPHNHHIECASNYSLLFPCLPPALPTLHSQR